MSSDTVTDLRTTADGVATEIPPTTSAPPNTEIGSPSKRSSKLGSPMKQLSRRFTSKRVIRVRNENSSNEKQREAVAALVFREAVRGDSFTLLILKWVPHAAVLMIVISMVAMAFVQAPTSNPREDDLWVRRPIQWGETQNMWMPFYSCFAMLMTLLFFHSFVRIAIVAEVHCMRSIDAIPRPTNPMYHHCACGNLADANFERAREEAKSREEAGAPAAASAAKPLLRQETKWLNKAFTQDNMLVKTSQVAPQDGLQEMGRRSGSKSGGGMRRGEWWRWWARGALPQLQTAPGGEVTMIRAAKTFAPSEVALWAGFLLACD